MGVTMRSGHDLLVVTGALVDEVVNRRLDL